MDSTTQTLQNVQDAFLNNIRRDRINVTIYLIGGVKLTGKIRSFDKFSVVLESGNLEQLIFKHAISTVSVPRGSIQHSHAGHQQQSAPPPPATPPSSAPPAGGGAAPTNQNQ
ncbi:MAG TPA: RNA chaperone Hfq [Blastocatellia bacterium]|nr:RNA chaperone Hfq [Blastocatellia bacterium]